MSKKLLGIVAGVAFVFGGNGSLAQSSSDMAADKGSTGQVQSEQRSTTAEKGTTASAEQLRTLRITVKDTDPKNNKVTFEAQVTPEANVEKNGQRIRINELKKGDEVRASFDPTTGEVVRFTVIPSPRLTRRASEIPQRRG